MKLRLLITTCCLSAPFFAAADSKIKEKLNIDKATVFLHGAELECSGSVSLSKGENEVLLSNVAGDINTESIIIKAANGVVVESITFQNNYLNTDNQSPQVKVIKDSITYYQQKKSLLDNKIAAINSGISLIQANNKINGDQTKLTPAELDKMLEYALSKNEALLNQRIDVNKQLEELNNHIGKLNLQLAEEQRRDYQPGGVLAVKFYAKESVRTPLKVEYISTNCGWNPIYDIMADNAGSPISLFYKANIYQNSGVKWDNVKLSISTGNPTQGMQIAELPPMYLRFYQPVVNRAYNYAPSAPMAKRGAALSSEGGRGDGSTYIIDGIQTTSMNQYTTVNNAGVNTAFDIELPYTIPSDGQEHLVAMKRYEVPAIFEYLVRPKMDLDAFLQAKITNWEQYNLLPGKTNIFYEGTYMGNGYLNTENVTDTINISLGRDKKIVVKREQDQKLRSTKMIGTNVRESFAYTISVRNTRKEDIAIVVEDQLPVSGDNELLLENYEIGNADYNNTTGLLKWQLKVKGNETKQVPFSYNIKYPKGKKVVEGR